jgi:hypothetical protein
VELETKYITPVEIDVPGVRVMVFVVKDPKELVVTI